MKESKASEWMEEYSGCLFIIVCIVAVFFLLKMCITHKYYVVKETGYFHSTNNEDSCRFIKQAKERDYTIKPFDNLDNAIEKGYKMCKMCFSDKRQQEYLEKAYKKSLIKQYLDDSAEWYHLRPGCEADYKKLVVYVDTSNVLHISGICATSGNVAYRHYIGNLPQISSLCESCVDREFCDFLYKIIYENTFDTNLIREDYGDYY